MNIVIDAKLLTIFTKTYILDLSLELYLLRSDVRKGKHLRKNEEKANTARNEWCLAKACEKWSGKIK